MADAEISVVIVTVSDSCSAGTSVDGSGDALSSWVNSNSMFPGKVLERRCIPDEKNLIQATLLDICDRVKPNLLLTTGGTGFAPRDVTPEATKAVLEKEAPGITIAMLEGSLKITPMAMLSRPACGIRGQTLIINLPGSKKASVECLELVSPGLRHAVDLLQDRPEVKMTHQLVQSTGRHQCTHDFSHQSAGQGEPSVEQVARRNRKSPYPVVNVKDSMQMLMNSVKQGYQLCTEVLNYTDVMGRILAEDVHATNPLPPFPASIKDGYAVIASDGAGLRQVLGDATAGSSPDELHLTGGQCVRINTGAPLPAGSDAIVQVEDTKLLAEADDGKTELEIEILVAPTPGKDIRKIGSDIAKGDKVLSKGIKLGFSDLGLLAMVGATKVAVFRSPLVGILSTGNELVQPGTPLTPGKIRDSNKTLLMALLKEHNFRSVDLGIADDSMAGLASKLGEGLKTADVIISTGGVSMGDKDYLKPVLKQQFGAEIHFGRVFMKPGLPTTFATVTYDNRSKFIFGLPGNPVSAAVTCNLYVIPALRQMSGYSEPFHTIIKTKLANDVELDPRPEYQRVVLKWLNDDDVPTAQVTGNQISSRLPSMRGANGLLVLPPRTDQRTSVRKGTIVECMVIGPI